MSTQAFPQSEPNVGVLSDVTENSVGQLNNINNIPEILKATQNFVVWRRETVNGKITKIPYDAKTGYHAASSRRSTWTTFENAVRIVAANPATAELDAAKGYNGIGIVLHGVQQDGNFLTGMDFDSVIHDGIIDPYVAGILEIAGNPYCEFSPSGKGIRAFGFAECLPEKKGRKFTALNDAAEIYIANEGGRYLTLTGKRFSGSGIPVIHDIELVHLLVSQMKNPKFRKLWVGDTSDKNNDQSAADASLLYELAVLTDGNAELMEDYFSQSALGQRDKWTDREDYRVRSIENALKFWKTNRQKSDGNSTGDAGIATGIEITCAASIAPKILEWLWTNRIPKNTLSMFSGEPDKGKSLVTLDLVARLTTGRDFPDGPNDLGPIDVLMLIAEDTKDTTVVPRLIAAGADLSRVFFVESVAIENEKSKAKRQLYFDTDLNALKKELLARPRIGLVIIDPVSNYLNVNMNREQEVRKVLTPLRDLGEEISVTMLCIMHFNKNAGANAMSRTGGAVALTGLPRASWCFMDDPDDKSRYLMLKIKANLAKKMGGISYTIVEDFIDIGGKQASVPKLVWGEQTSRDADDILQTQSNPEERGVGAAKKWLEEYLADGEWHKSAECYEAAEAAGISVWTIKNAKRKLKIETKQRLDTGGDGKAWFIRLPKLGGTPGESATEQTPPVDGLPF